MGDPLGLFGNIESLKSMQWFSYIVLANSRENSDGIRDPRNFKYVGLL